MLKIFNKDRCYIIAEIGGNFTTFDEAKILVDLANNSGVDAVKLQTYKADTIVTKTAKFDLDNVGDMVQHQLFQKYQIDFDLHKKVFDYIESKGVAVNSNNHSPDLLSVQLEFLAHLETTKDVEGVEEFLETFFLIIFFI